MDNKFREMGTAALRFGLKTALYIFILTAVFSLALLYVVENSATQPAQVAQVVTPEVTKLLSYLIAAILLYHLAVDVFHYTTREIDQLFGVPRPVELSRRDIDTISSALEEYQTLYEPSDERHQRAADLGGYFQMR